MVKFIDLITPYLIKAGAQAVPMAEYQLMEQRLLTLELQIANPAPGLWFVFRTTVVDGIKRILPAPPEIWQQRTGLEKWTVGIISGIVVWNLCVHKVPRRFVGTCAKMFLPGWRWISAKFVLPETVMVSDGYVAESVRDGSYETTLTPPRSQCAIVYEGDNGSHVLHGNAVRFNHNCLVGPDHVLTDDRPKYAKGKQGLVPLEGRERIPLEADLVMIELSDTEFSRVGMAVATIGCLSKLGTTVTIATSLGAGTVSHARNNPDLFGEVIYEGTTREGYSGSAYMAGQSTIGVHVHGGRYNGGFSASFVQALINSYKKRYNEGTSEYLEKMYKEGKRIKAKSYGVEEVMIWDVDSGRYDLVKRSSVMRHFPNFEEDGFLVKKTRREYQDNNPDNVQECSGESKTSKTSGASNILEQPRDSDDQQLLSLMNEFTKLSRSQRKDMLEYQRTLRQPIVTTPGPAQNSGQQPT